MMDFVTEEQEERNNMEILKARGQAMVERARKNIALNEVKRCPECGYETCIWDILPGATTKGNYYRASCQKCGCVWKSSEF